METKSKVTQRSKQAPSPFVSGNGGEHRSEYPPNDQSAAAVQVVDEVQGTTDSTIPVQSGTELTEAEGHIPVSSPISRTSKKRESTETFAETEPVVEASLAA